MGNRTLIRRRALPEKREELEIEPDGNALEREADRMADRALAAGGSSSEPPPSAGGSDAGEGNGDPTVRRRSDTPGYRPRVDGATASGVHSLRNGGEPLPAPTRSFFERRFDRSFDGVRIHRDARAGRLAEDLNARAFTFGRDIVFGAGQFDMGSGAGRHLVAHELAHVVQQAPETASPSTVYRRAAEPRAEDRSGVGPELPGLLSEDGVVTAEGGLGRSEFLDRLESAVRQAAETLLSSAGRTTRDCPYIPFWFAYLRRKSAAELERMLIRWAPRALEVERAEEYIPLIVERLRTGIVRWLLFGEVSGVPEDLAAPPDAPPMDPSEGSPDEGLEGPRVLLAARDGAAPPPPSPAGVRAGLGGGRPLEGGVRRRMESAFGAPLDGVRVHTGAPAAATSRRLHARAFTVGQDVGFGAGEYRPGTPVGDAILAHELAHTLQQGPAEGAEAPTGAIDGDSLERDADRSALGVLAKLWAGGRRKLSELAGEALPRLRSGVRLQRCIFDDPREMFREALGEETTYTPGGDDLERQRIFLGELRSLLTRKEEILLGGGQEFGEIALIDERIEQAIDELGELGITLPRPALYALAAGDADLDTVDLLSLDGSISRTTPGSSLRVGARETFSLNLRSVPPNRQVRVRWVYRINGNLHPLIDNEFRAGLSEFPAPFRGTRFELDDASWLAFSYAGDMEAVDDFEVFAYVYLDDQEDYSLRVSSGIIRFEEFEPSELDLRVENPSVVEGTELRASIANWAPPWNRYVVHWFLDDEVIQVDQPVLLGREVSGSGTRTLRVSVYRTTGPGGQPVGYDFLTGEPRFREEDPFLTAEQEVIVRAPGEVAEEALASQLERIPLEEYPSLAEMGQTISTSISELEAREGQAESEARREYLETRREAQENRLERLRAHAGDLSLYRPMPDDPAQARPDVRYARPIPAGMLIHQTGGLQPLSVYLLLHGSSDDSWTARLVDVTGRDVYRFDGSGSSAGAAITDAFEDWGSLEHPYPRNNTVVHAYTPPGLTLLNGFATNNPWNLAKAWIDGILMVGGVIAAGLLFLAPEATVTKVLGVAILAASVARGTVAIAENINVGIAATDSRNVLEGIGIVTSFAGIGGSTLRTAGLQATHPFVYRTGNWLVMGSLAGDGGTLVFATSEAIDAIQAAQGDPDLSEQERLNRILTLIGSTVANGAMVFAGNRDLFQGGFRRSDFFRSQFRSGASIELDVGTRLDMLDFLRRNDPAFDLQAGRDLEPGQLVSHFFVVQERMSARTRLEGFLTADQLRALTGGQTAALANLDDEALRRVAARRPEEVADYARRVQRGEIAAGSSGAVRGPRVYDLGGGESFRSIVDIFNKITGGARRRGTFHFHGGLGTRMHGSRLSHTQPNTYYDLTVPVTVSGSTVDVPVQVTIKARGYDIGGGTTTDPTIGGRHGADSGPGAFTLNWVPPDQPGGTGRWVATVEVDPHLATLDRSALPRDRVSDPDDLTSVIGHELDEIADIVVQSHAHTGAVAGTTPDLARIPTIVDAQSEAVVFRPGSTETAAFMTAHDKAAVGELVVGYERIGTGGQDGVERFARLLRSMGVDHTIDRARLLQIQAALRTGGVTDVELLRRVEVHWMHEVYLNGPLANIPAASRLPNQHRVITREVIDHLLFPRPSANFQLNGLSGGHETARLQALNTDAGSPFYVMRESSMSLPYGTDAHGYWQYRRVGGAAKGTTPPPSAVGQPTTSSHQPVAGTHYNAADWEVSQWPKSTVDDLMTFLPQAEMAFADFYAQKIAGRVTSAQSGTRFRHVYGGVTYMGFYNYDGSDVSSLSLNSIFVDATTIP